MPAPKILGISGSLRPDSYSGGLLRAAQELVPAGVEFEAYAGLADLPAFNEGLEDPAPAAVALLRTAISEADALLVITPEYNASIPGALKNAVDWASRPHGLSAIAGKPVAVIGNSPSPFGAAWAQEHLRRSLTVAGAPVLERELTIGKVNGRISNGELTNADTRDEIALLITELIEFSAAVRAELETFETAA